MDFDEEYRLVIFHDESPIVALHKFIGLGPYKVVLTIEKLKLLRSNIR
jgi:hypothetical protein